LEESKHQVHTNEDNVLGYYNQALDIIVELKLKGNEGAFRGVDFEKDDDSNYHIDFIHYASDCRAYNYKLDTEDHSREKSRVIAGKILPAVLTATATITGLQTLDLMRSIRGERNMKKYRSKDVQLGCNTYNFKTLDPDSLLK
jgi:ubiquitin-activating enzyme E1